MGTPRKTALLAGAVLVLALLLVVLGVAQGDPLDVYRKAARICFECIGIG
ncbi:MAG: hypothetical protein LBL86_08035 [Coriobacteriales bacterium]|jgi:hypothetical protein|nr:hypothetical protein [Coriobacteriales bacterium]